MFLTLRFVVLSTVLPFCFVLPRSATRCLSLRWQGQTWLTRCGLERLLDSLHAALHTRDTTNDCCFNLPGKKTSYLCLHAVQSAVEKVLLFPVVFNLDASFRRDAFDKQIFLRSANWMCSFPQPWPACQRNFLCLRCPDWHTMRHYLGV